MSRPATPRQEAWPRGHAEPARGRTSSVRGPAVRRTVPLTVSLALGVTVAIAGAASATGAPAGRAYELVSPADHLAGAVPGVSTDLHPMPGRSSDDGDRLLFGAGSSMGPNWSGPANPMIFASRTTSGWSVRSAIRSTDEGNQVFGLGSHEPQSGWLTRDGREFVFGVSQLGDVPGAGPLLGGIYRSVDALERPEWLSRPAGGSAAEGVENGTVSTGDDTRTVAFVSSTRLTDDAPPEGTLAVYVRRGGELRLASVDPNGVPLTQNTVLANAWPSSNSPFATQAMTMRNQVAGNGRYVLMVDGQYSARGAVSIYARDLNAGVTRQLAGPGSGVPFAGPLATSWSPPIGMFAGVSLDPRTVPDGYVFAARDAPRAFFHHDELPGGGTPLLYDANLETGEVTARNAISGPPLGLSDDGEHMLFLQPPANATEGESPAGDWTLRYWSAANPSTSTAVGTITIASSPTQFQAVARVYRSSADGKSWTFTAAGSPDPDRPNADPSTQQLYRWTVGESAPTCLTCESTDGVAREAGVSLTIQESIVTERFLSPTIVDPNAGGNVSKMSLAQQGHSVSDGRWLLFDSPDRLVGEDQNDVRDVYLWDRDAGSGRALQLVTSGQGNTPSWALDLDPTGRNAFFTTREGLVPADDDGSYDVYVARIGGGFPDDSGESCVGEGCRPPVIPDPPRGPVGSTPLGPVTVGPKTGVQQGTPKLRVRSIRTSSSRLTVRVNAPGAGRIRVSGKQVRTTTRTAKRAAVYTVKVPLSTSARRTVARGKTVKVALRVQFTPTGSKKSTRVSSSVSVKKGR